MKKYNFEVTQNTINEFICEYLNVNHQNFQIYVKGIKLFVEFLEEKENPKTENTK